MAGFLQRYVAVLPCKIGWRHFLRFETRINQGFRQRWIPCKIEYTHICMSTGVYIRVSSPKGQKTDSQRAELEAWLKRHRHKGVQWFEDHDSGASLQRDAFQKLQADIFAGTITTVVVWKLDRLARSLKEGVNVLADWCQRGVRVIAVTQQIDLSGPVGHLIASLLFGIAEIELQHVKERQAIGITLARKRGVYTGRKAGTTKVAPSRARALKKQGFTIGEIAKALGVKERTVYNYLSCF
jgi:DNA invertase Pin-like site-specific DNA recombinase